MTTPSGTPLCDEREFSAYVTDSTMRSIECKVVNSSYARSLELQLAQHKRALDVAVRHMMHALNCDYMRWLTTASADSLRSKNEPHCTCGYIDALARIEAAKEVSNGK